MALPMTANAPTAKNMLPEGEALYGHLPSDAGEWLFKDQDQVLGPIPADHLLAKLYDGQVTSDTLVAKEVGEWKPLREVWFFGAHLQRVRQKVLYDDAVKTRQQMAAKQATTRFIVVTTLLVLVTGSSLAASRYALVERPWEDKRDYLAERPELGTLPDNTPRVTVQEKPAEAAGDSGSNGDGASDEDKKKAAKKKKGRGGRDDDERPAGPVLPLEQAKQEIKNVFLAGVDSYKDCIRKELAVNPDLPSTVTVQFVVRNDGSIRDFEIQEKELRFGSLERCLGKKVGALRFPRFSGEVVNFIFPFKLKRK
jgi:hypothetical protein